MRLAKCTWRLARGVCTKNKGRRRRSRAGPVHRFAVGGPVARPAGSVVVVAKGEARRVPRSVVAGRDLPLPRFSEARGGVIFLLATFSAVLAVYGE